MALSRRLSSASKTTKALPVDRRVTLFIEHAEGPMADKGSTYHLALKTDADTCCQTSNAQATPQINWSERFTIELSDKQSLRFLVYKKGFLSTKLVATSERYTPPGLVQLSEVNGIGGHEPSRLQVDLYESEKKVRKVGTLRLTLVQLPMDSKHNLRAVSDEQSTHFEKIRLESLNHLQTLDGNLRALASLLPGHPLVNINFAVLKTIKQQLDTNAKDKPLTNCVPMLLEALNETFQPFGTMTTHALSKQSETSVSFLLDMLVASIRALARLEEYLMMTSANQREKEHAEIRVNSCTDYFRARDRLRNQQPPSFPLFSDRRIHLDILSDSGHPFSQSLLSPNLPHADQALDARLPLPDLQATLDDPVPTWLTAEWLICRSFQPTKQILCLVGRSHSGKTQLVANLIESLNDLNYFGAYFSFDHTKHVPSVDVPTTESLLAAFPMTLAHQLYTAIPSIENRLIQGLNTGLPQDTSVRGLERALTDLIFYPLARLSKSPQNSLEKSVKPNTTSQNVDPVLIVLDDIDRLGEEGVRTLLTALNNLSRRKETAIPAYVRVLVVSRPMEVFGLRQQEQHANQRTSIEGQGTSMPMGLRDEFPTTTYFHEIQPSISYVDKPRLPPSPLSFSGESEVNDIYMRGQRSANRASFGFGNRSGTASEASSRRGSVGSGAGHIHIAGPGLSPISTTGLGPPGHVHGILLAPPSPVPSFLSSSSHGGSVGGHTTSTSGGDSFWLGPPSPSLIGRANSTSTSLTSSPYLSPVELRTPASSARASWDAGAPTSPHSAGGGSILGGEIQSICGRRDSLDGVGIVGPDDFTSPDGDPLVFVVPAPPPKPKRRSTLKFVDAPELK